MAQTQLTKGMFGSEFNQTSTLFGLSCGQMRHHDMVHNGGWYNQLGEKLGWGDLCPTDFKRIAAELEDGEIFIVLREDDSFRNFVTHNPGTIGSDCTTKPDAEAPGVEYVAEKCRFIITKSRLYFVARHEYEEKNSDIRVNDLHFTVLKHDAAKDLITPKWKPATRLNSNVACTATA